MQIIDPQAPSLTPKWQRFLAIRHQAVAIDRDRGQFIRLENGPPMITWQQDGFELLYRTPFQKMRLSPKAAAMGMPNALPFCLDIWATIKTPLRLVPARNNSGLLHKWQPPREGSLKVFNAEWSTEGGAIQAIAFKRGDWEEAFLALAVNPSEGT